MKQKTLLKQIGKQLMLARTRENITQDALAKASGVNRAAVSMYEHGTVNISLGTLMRMADVLGYKIEISLRKLPTTEEAI